MEIEVNLYNFDEQVVFSETVKLDSNFSFPEILQDALDEGILEDDIDIEYSIDMLNKNEYLSIKKILLVDDEEILLEQMKEIIERSTGHYVKDFQTTESAYEEFSENPLKYDFVITDNQMPSGDSGGVLAKKIKCTTPRTTVYVISGDTESIDDNIFDLHVNAKISKPIDTGQIKTLLGGKAFHSPDELDGYDIAL